MTNDESKYEQVVTLFLKDLWFSSLSDEERLYNVLVARGFLLEKDRLILSDNSCLRESNNNDDRSYLNLLLQRLCIGYIEDMEIVINGTVDEECLKTLFLDHNGTEALELTYWSEWNYFKRRRHGNKISVCYMEPFIARLVKAISSIGVITNSSCDGHGYKEARISFPSKYNSAWMSIIFKILMNDKKVADSNIWGSNWDFWGRELIVNNCDKYQLFCHIQTLAKIVYSNRVKLREVKEKSLSNVTKEEVGGLNFAEIENILEKKVKTKFPEFEEGTII